MVPAVGRVDSRWRRGGGGVSLRAEIATHDMLRSGKRLPRGIDPSGVVVVAPAADRLTRE